MKKKKKKKKGKRKKRLNIDNIFIVLLFAY